MNVCNPETTPAPTADPDCSYCGDDGHAIDECPEVPEYARGDVWVQRFPVGHRSAA